LCVGLNGTLPAARAAYLRKLWKETLDTKK